MNRLNCTNKIACTMEIYAERWPIAGGFRIARGSRSHAEVVVLRLHSGDQVAWAECVPYAHYGESVDGVQSDLRRLESSLIRGINQEEIQNLLNPGAARNALDCAFLHLRAKIAGEPIWKLLGLQKPDMCLTAMTIGLGSPEQMADRARQLVGYPLLKLKLGGNGDCERVQEVRKVAGSSRIIVDANESWNPDTLRQDLRAMADMGVEMVEQPLPAGKDILLSEIERPLIVSGDESVHSRSDLSRLRACYDCVNIKLDKSGGLTEAIAMVGQAKSYGLQTMVGCMVCTSLGIAPAMLLANSVDYVDLDGALLLQRDREFAILETEGQLLPPLDSLWG